MVAGLEELTSEAMRALGLTRAPTVLRPSEARQVAGALVEARDAEHAVVPWGGGTEQDLGAPPCRCDVLLRTDALRGILACAPEDLTLSARAGTTLAEIAHTLAPFGQFLPLDLPHAERATIGGVVATAAVPVRRLRYGGVRDLVIGLEIATTAGELCKSGGRVVKNVAGYDLNKLYTGSLGTLGVITAVHLKVQPLPSRQALVTGIFAGLTAASAAAAALAGTSLGYGAVILSRESDGAPWTLHVFAEGFAGTVERQCTMAREAIARHGGETHTEQDVEVVRDRIRTAAEWRHLGADADGALLRGSVAPARLEAVLEQLIALSARLGLPAAIQADAALGTFFARLDKESDASAFRRDAGRGHEQQVRFVEEGRVAVRALSGHLVLAGGPLSPRRACDPWGASQGTTALARSLKAVYDPAGIMNPGRYAHGI